MKKIVFVLGNYKNGGMAMQATNLSNEFAKQGYSVDILVTREMGNSFFSTVENVRIVPIKEYNNVPECVKHLDDRKIRDKKIKQIKRVRLFTKHFKKLDHYLSKKSENVTLWC